MDENDEFDPDLEDNPFADLEDSDEYQFETDEAFSFDDDDDDTFSFGEEDETVAETASVSNDEDEEDFEFTDIEDSSAKGSGGEGLIQGLINKYKDENPKDLIVPLAIGAGALVALFFLFSGFINLFSGSTPQKRTQSQVAVQHPEIAKPAPPQLAKPEEPTKAEPAADTTKVAEKPEPDEPAVSEDKPSEISTDDLQNNEVIQKMLALQEDLNKRANQLEELNKTFDRKLYALEQQNAENVAQMNNLAQGVKGIEGQVSGLNSALNSLVKAVKDQSRPPVPPPISKPSKQQMARDAGMRDAGDERGKFSKFASQQSQQEVRKIETYFVQAVIPGRAWLKDSNGKIITVAIGDQVPGGYGRVTHINSRDGVVTTNKGAQIEYGIEQF